MCHPTRCFRLNGWAEDAGTADRRQYFLWEIRSIQYLYFKKWYIVCLQIHAPEPFGCKKWWLCIERLIFSLACLISTNRRLFLGCWLMTPRKRLLLQGQGFGCCFLVFGFDFKFRKDMRYSSVQNPIQLLVGVTNVPGSQRGRSVMATAAFAGVRIVRKTNRPI